MDETVGNDTNSICYELHWKAVDILEGRKHDPAFYPVIYGVADDGEWTDPAVWKKANPSLGITIGIDKVEAACEQAKQNPAEENTFRQLRLNQWVKQDVRWMPMKKWDACAFSVDEKVLEGRVRYGGLDLSSTTDITAFVLVFPPEDMEDPDDKYIVLPYFWVPEETLDLRVRRDHVPYTDDTVYNGWYKSVYQSPVLDLHDLQKSVDQEEPEGSTLDSFSLELFEDISYIMAMHADPQNVPDTPDEWLDRFGMFSIYQVLPEIIELWGFNVQTQAESKKLRATDREMATPLLLLRAVQIGEMDLLTIGKSETKKLCKRYRPYISGSSYLL